MSRTNHNPRTNRKGRRVMKDEVIRPNFSPSSIRSRLQQEQQGNGPPPKTEIGQAEILTLDPAGPDDKVDPLPKPGDAYKVHGRHGNKPDVTLHFVLKDYSYEGFSYGDCERVRLVAKETPGTAPVLIVRFSGSVVTEAVIEGRHLHGLYNWIGLHRVPWIWEHPSPAQFTDDNATLISRITFRQIER